MISASKNVHLFYSKNVPEGKPCRKIFGSKTSKIEQFLWEKKCISAINIAEIGRYFKNRVW